jgi:hypothetical protein
VRFRVFRPGLLMIMTVALASAATAPALSTATPATVAGRPAKPGHGALVSVRYAAHAPRPHADAAKYTLTVMGTTRSGKPVSNGAAWVFDATNMAAFSDNTAGFRHGAAKFSVPAGTYWVIGEFDSSSQTTGYVTRLDVVSQVRVGRNTTVRTTASAATSKVTMVTPRPAVAVDVRFEANLTDRLGSAASIDWYDAPGQIWVNQVPRKPAVGALLCFAFEQLAGQTSSTANAYGYNLDYADPPGIIPSQRYVARPSNLAVITDRYYQDVHSTGAWLIWGGFPSQQLQAFWLTPLHLPGQQIQYFSTAPTLRWSPGYNAFTPASEFPTGGQADDTYQALRPGEHEVVDWNRYPLHPQPDVSAGGGGLDAQLPLIPAALRAGNKLTLTVRPFSDNVPGHLSDGSAPKTRISEAYQIDQNGVSIAHGSAYQGIPPVTLSSQPSVIRFTLDATRTGRSYLLSTHTHTVWTWRSVRQPGATVPRDWYCSYRFVHGRTVWIRRCSVQPMMTLSYQVNRLALNGSAPSGPQVVGLRVGHIQLAQAAKVTGAKAWASCDSGQTWRRATVSSLGRGQFGLHFGVPSGCQVSLRVSAADAAGGSITETITRAYDTTS